MIGAVVLLLSSCSRPADHTSPLCTISVRVGESIQAVLDGAPPGAVICLPTGTWTENLHVTKPVTLRGAGPTETTVRSNTFATPVVTIGPWVEPKEAVVLIGIAFTGASASCSDPGGCAHGLLVVGSAVVQATRCSFAGNSATGVSVRDEARAELQDCSIVANTWYGLAVQDSGQAALTSVTLSGNRSTGIWLADAAHLALVSSTVTRCEGHGLWIRNQSTFIATDSTISSCDGHGLWVRDKASANLSGCTVTGHRDSGVWIEHDAEISLSSCVVERTWDGIVARNNARVWVADCTISAVRWDGIKVQGTAWASIVGSTLLGGRGSGVHVGDAAEAEICDNRIESWIAHGILGLSRFQPTGGGNRLANNGVDLSGNVQGYLRVPLHIPDQEMVRFPNPTYATVQQAVDAVLPGGKLVLAEGIYPGGVTLGKPLHIESEGIVLLTANFSNESPVLSLVGGADLVMSGIALGYGSEGITLGANARASLSDCVLSDNTHGVHATGTARVELLRCSVSRNQQGGVWLWDSVQGDIRESSFTANGLCGIGLAGSSTTRVTRCSITENGRTAGIAVRDSAQAHIEGNTITGNYGVGVALYHDLCVGLRYVFAGRVTGGENVFTGNYKGDVCPGELSFLGDGGGELDLRR
jgi:nitrous oxidase accessory protein NosD